MEFYMINDEIIQEVEIVVCKCCAFVGDKRTGKKEHLTMFITLSGSEEEPKPIVEKVLNKRGYYFYGFEDNPEITTVKKDADDLFKIGQLI